VYTHVNTVQSVQERINEIDHDQFNHHSSSGFVPVVLDHRTCEISIRVSASQDRIYIKTVQIDFIHREAVAMIIVDRTDQGFWYTVVDQDHQIILETGSRSQAQIRDRELTGQGRSEFVARINYRAD
jgi:tRNA(Ile2) C34 agmatinyltransferase TiaS